MIAEVYIDIPAKPVNRPFDYRIPDDLAELVRPGVRVTVPFGRTRRLGFVTALKEKSEFKQLKGLDSVEDHVPVLTPELIELGGWLANQTLCSTVTAFQAMLPAAMKADYKKLIVIDQIERLLEEDPELAAFLQSVKQPIWSEIIKAHPEWAKRMQRAIKHGLISVQQLVKNQAKAKKAAAVTVEVPRSSLEDELNQLGKRSYRQKEVLEFLLKQPDLQHFHETIQKLVKHGLSREAIMKLAEKGLLKHGYIEQFRDPYNRPVDRTKPLSLTEEQAHALEPILTTMQNEEHKVFLCHGVTGSGKTEIYLQSIQRVIEQEKQAIVLVPEISLTPQMVSRFKGRFGDHVAVMHSGLSRGEKYDEWRKIREEKVQVVVGARSAVFAPFKKLGLIIIDEEHESSYKQEDMPRYHARDVAIHRAKKHHCPVVLGSATPALESFARAQKNVYTLLSLKERVNHRPLPSVHIIDLREELREGNRSVFSKELLEKIKDRLAKQEQSVLFLNRRGYSTFMMCRSCGAVVKCPHCDISLTYHRAQQLLKCHYCGYEQAVPAACPNCSSDAMRFFGTGTQKVEAELNRLIPEARVIRMDVDTTRKKGSHEKLLRRFGKEEADILLGTQMIAKGLDFPKVTLVGVLAADSLLHLPDFRASEKTFQLLTQVSGRAGRHALPGEVVIQSYAPDHYAVTDAAHHDYGAFYQQEMLLRKRAGYPPFYYLVLISLSHPEPAKAAESAERIASILRRKLSHTSQIYGPVVPSVAKIKDRYRYQCMVKYKREPELMPVLHQIMQHFQDSGKAQLQLTVDLNPVTLM
ncbi:primosomal protein N' [Sporolactobacillus terrae]|uniref:Replication restart protein PriA n=1 Tax=Sporolactobacillus terrae TaxID=269673 RepID=A0ABX5Q6M8_9BACL|nr:primosomal protein N' [Sporolactobacillus terrae]QAA22300.1 primosomal protein N' [Sporolactobacillus terrae]QAA25275.1 primosomal protein N' [Sporolactobacillus terrae]